jgi:hypothetical protein
LGQAPRKGYHGPFDGCKHLATVARHPLLGLVPAQIDDRAAAAVLHALADCARQLQRGQNIHLPKGRQFALKRPLSRVARQHIGPGYIDPKIDA